MVNDSPKSYPELDDLVESDLDPNSSYSKMLGLVGTKKRVLDVGCASGYLARLMSAHECRVTGIDINPDAVAAAQRYCERALVADLDVKSLSGIFPKERFDVIVFGDVLEHLRDPWSVLDDARRLLSYRGHAVVSIPNIAHGAIRLALLQGRFEYSEFGIVDNTHLRFFTRQTLDELFLRSGYAVEAVEKTVLPLFAPTDLVPTLSRSDFDETVLERIARDEDFETLQFVVRARALSDEEKTAELTRAFTAARTELAGAVESLSTATQKIDAMRQDLVAAALAHNAELTARLEDEDRRAGERIRELERGEATALLALNEIAESVKVSVRDLQMRIAKSNRELFQQRTAYDALAERLSRSRAMLAEATGIRRNFEQARAAYELLVTRYGDVVGRNRDLAAELEATATALEETRADLRGARTELETTARALESTLGSRSWRMMEPLRRAMALVRR